MWKFIDNYFTFSTKERNGILVLLLATLIVLIAPKVYLYFKPVQHADSAQLQAEVDAFAAVYNREKGLLTDTDVVAVSSTTATTKEPVKNTTNTITYFTFDPNKIGVNEWMKLGFSEKQAQSIENYKAAGAVFYKPEDLKRAYAIGEEGYARLAPYVKIDVAAINHKYASVKYFTFDPNAIGIDEWIKLGFSEKQARSIEKYKATGVIFRKPEDLKKVYVIGEEGYERLMPYIKIAK